MAAFFTYLIISTLCISINYLFYVFLSKKNTQIKLLRLYLVSSIVLSLLLPFNTFNINTSFFYAQEDVIAPLEISNNLNNAFIKKDQKLIQASSSLSNQINWIAIISYAYLSVTSFLLFKLIFSLIKLVFLYRKSEKEYTENITLIYNHKFKNSFSIFYWVFIPHALKSTKELESIILHEKTHATQFHSYDLLLTELLIIFSWFNPVTWIIKKNLELIHEFLADEGVLSTGVNSSHYQALLINQVAEEQLIRVSSNFNHSLIKKRIIMMSTEKTYNSNKRSLLILMPITIILFLGISCVNGQTSDDENNILINNGVIEKNVMYLGINNPLDVFTKNYDSKDLTVKVDGTEIISNNGQYIVKPLKKGKTTVTIFSDKKKINETEFEVERILDPRAYLKIDDQILEGSARIKRTAFEKLTNLKVYYKMQKLNSNLPEILSFNISAIFGNIIHERKINSDNFDFAKSDDLKKGNKIYIQDIQIKMPDNTIRTLAPIILNLVD